MLKRESDNPFERLEIPSESTEREIVERGRDRARGMKSAEKIVFREAVERLIQDPLQRIEYETLTFSGADYSLEEAWRQFNSRWGPISFALKTPANSLEMEAEPLKAIDVNFDALSEILPPLVPLQPPDEIDWEMPAFPDDVILGEPFELKYPR